MSVDRTKFPYNITIGGSHVLADMVDAETEHQWMRKCAAPAKCVIPASSGAFDSHEAGNVAGQGRDSKSDMTP